MSSRVFMRLGLVTGDIVLFLLAVPITLAVRVLGVPTGMDIVTHLIPFALLTALFVLVFFSAGLYDAETAITRRELAGTIFGAQVVNIILAALFFFFVPFFGITPKVTLFIYLLVSVILVTPWHFFALFLSRSRKAVAVVVGDGKDVDDVVAECTSGSCAFTIQTTIPISGRTQEEIVSDIERSLTSHPDFVIADFGDERMQGIFSMFSLHKKHDAVLMNFTKVYEELFRRVPLSSVSYTLFLSNDKPERILYAFIKRTFDIFLGSILFLFFIFLLPFVWLALRLEGTGSLFITQERMGQGGEKISVLKFRSMRLNKSTSSEWTVEEAHHNPITKVGAFLRKTSLDELPQVLSVLSGELSLIGPRSDIVGLADRLAEAIPFYSARYNVTPGISGWAQVNQRYSPGNISPQSIEESRVRLAYDLYYVNHRSPLLDFSIALRTLKTLITRWIS